MLSTAGFYTAASPQICPLLGGAPDKAVCQMVPPVSSCLKGLRHMSHRLMRVIERFGEKCASPLSAREGNDYLLHAQCPVTASSLLFNHCLINLPPLTSRSRTTAASLSLHQLYINEENVFESRRAYSCRFQSAFSFDTDSTYIHRRVGTVWQRAR